jgi:hypothetical protein
MKKAPDSMRRVRGWIERLRKTIHINYKPERKKKHE